MKRPPPIGGRGARVAAERVGDGHEESPYWAEHRCRYKFAGSYCAGRSVLDIACGTGWGSRMLHEAGAKWVLGVDSSAEAIEAARANLVNGMDAQCGDAAEIPAADRSFDVVVSFETIEHLHRPDEFLLELRRVLRRDAVLILSTPNARHTQPLAGKPRNPFHVHEYDPQELKATLGRYFSKVDLRGQRVRPQLRPCPYWEREELYMERSADRLKAIRWKALRRLPPGMGEAVATRVLGHPLLPGEDDFVFEASEVDHGHALIAVCRP